MPPDSADVDRANPNRADPNRPDPNRPDPNRADPNRPDPDRADLDSADQSPPDGYGRRPDAPVDDWEDRARRAVADLDNVRKRHVRELQSASAAERAQVAAGWLPVIDNLELALAHADADPASIVEGVRAVRDQAVAVLARLGYARRDETGVPFDPAQHEVLTVVEDPDAPPGTVVQVLRPGYGDAERQLRPMAVAVSRKPE
ncbi:nucleotide exchange factor GrpE [Jatrophihabitans sp. DSM 45814]